MTEQKELLKPKVQLFPHGIVQNIGFEKPMFLLKDKEEKKFLPVWLEAYEKESLNYFFQETKTKSHPYIGMYEVLQDLGWHITDLYFTHYDHCRLYAKLNLKCGNKIRSYHKPAEDLLLVALYSGAAMYAEEELFERLRELQEEWLQNLCFQEDPNSHDYLM